MMRGDETAQGTGAASPEDAAAGSLRPIDAGPRRAPPPGIEQWAPRSSGVDRLAQLARLIEQDETLAAIVRDGRSEQPIELSRPRETLPSPQLAREDKAFERSWENEAGSALVDPGLGDAPPGEPHDPPEYGEYDGPDYSNGLPDQRRWLKLFAALIGLALAGSASALAYWELSDKRGRGHEPPVKAASSSPDKTAPSPREDSGADERPRDRSDERSVNATGRTIAGVEEPADAKPPTPEALPPLDIVVGQAATKIAGLIPAPTLPGGPAATAQDQPPDKKPAPRRRAPVVARSGAHGVRYDVQLSSERSEAAAHLRSLMLQTTHRDLFAGRKPFIRRADLGDRGVYYRVQMGPFEREEAKQICGDLKKSGADCIVQRN